MLRSSTFNPGAGSGSGRGSTPATTRPADPTGSPNDQSEGYPRRAMVSEYPPRVPDFQTELHREDYLFRSGRKRDRESARIRADYSDLFKPSAIADLRAKLEETSQQRETERRSINRLIAFAVEGNLLARAREISSEIENYEPTARRTGEGEVAQDLRAERLEMLRDGARELGYENRLAMRRELRGFDDEKLAGQARKILSKTESGYVNALSWLLPRET